MSKTNNVRDVEEFLSSGYSRARVGDYALHREVSSLGVDEHPEKRGEYKESIDREIFPINPKPMLSKTDKDDDDDDEDHGANDLVIALSDFEAEVQDVCSAVEVDLSPPAQVRQKFIDRVFSVRKQINEALQYLEEIDHVMASVPLRFYDLSLLKLSRSPFIDILCNVLANSADELHEWKESNNARMEALALESAAKAASTQIQDVRAVRRI